MGGKLYGEKMSGDARILRFCPLGHGRLKQQRSRDFRCIYVCLYCEYREAFVIEKAIS